MPLTFTLGYQGRRLEEFVGLLRWERIDAVVDVRDVPWSHKQGFSKKPLAAALEGARIAYVSASFAGNPKRLRAAAKDLNDALALYAGHLDTSPGVLQQLETLLADLHGQGKRVCLLCFEDDPAECHRAVLADRWARAGEGRSVRHLRFADARKKRAY